MPPKRVPHDAFDAFAYLGVVAVARHVDQAGIETLVGIAAREQAHAPALVEIDDAAHAGDQFRGRHLEQFVAREVLDDVHHGLGVVALRRQVEVLDHRIELAPQQRDLGRRRVIRARGPQAEKTMLAVDAAGGIEGLDAHVVEITRAVHGRRRIGLGEHQQVGLARLVAQMTRQHDGSLSAAARRSAQDAEPAVGIAHQHVARSAALQVIVAVTQEHEVPVVHPGEQRARLGRVRAGHGQRTALQLIGDGAHTLQHRPEVGDRLAHVIERAVQAAQQLARLGFVRRPVDLHHLPRLGHAGALVVGQGEQPAARIATHPEHRVHDEMHRDVHRTENDADGIDQEGHVGRYHAHQRAVRGAGGIAVERRRQFHQRLAGLAHAPELQVRKRGRGEICRFVHAQVVFGDAAEEAGARIRPRVRAAPARNAWRARLSSR